MTMPISMPLAAIDPTLVIWFIVGIVYFVAQIFEKTKGAREGNTTPRPQRKVSPRANGEDELRDFLEQLTGNSHHEEEEEEHEEIALPQPVITFDPPPRPPAIATLTLDPEPEPLPMSQDEQDLEDVYKMADDIQDIKEIKSLESSMATSMSRSGSTASMLVKMFNVRMPHMKYNHTPSSPIRYKTKPPNLKGKHAYAQAQLSRIILEPPKALEEKPFEV